MIVIKKLDTEKRTATIDLDYADAICMLNCFYHQAHSKIDKDLNFNDVYGKIVLLQGLLKHAHLPDYELELLHSLGKADISDM